MMPVGGVLVVPALHGMSKWVPVSLQGVPSLPRAPPGSGWLPGNPAMVGALGRVTELSFHVFVLIVSSSIECKRNLLSKFVPTLVSALGKYITD